MIDPVLVDSGCDENLVCGVCTLVLRVPMSGCPQGHTFCERCYCTHLVERPTCPTCRHPVDPDGLVRNRPIENMVLTLRVACSHSDPSVYLTPCGWKGTLGELDAHLGSSCPNEPVSCPNAGCVVRLPRRLLAAHARDDCTRRPVPCQHCGLDVAKSELAAHEAGALQLEVPSWQCHRLLPQPPVWSGPGPGPIHAPQDASVGRAGPVATHALLLSACANVAFLRISTRRLWSRSDSVREWLRSGAAQEPGGGARYDLPARALPVPVPRVRHRRPSA
jgi:hypothetical protein